MKGKLLSVPYFKFLCVVLLTHCVAVVIYILRTFRYQKVKVFFFFLILDYHKSNFNVSKHVGVGVI